MNLSSSKIGKKNLNLLLPGCARLETHYGPREIASPPSPPVRDRTETAYPLISIVIPSYNQGRFIGQTLQSIIGQNYPNLELIIVDGGSDDETLRVIESFATHIKWWVSEEDSGQANAINKGMQHAEGDILARLNSDDCLMPNALFYVARRFMTSKNADVVYGHRVLINEAG